MVTIKRCQPADTCMRGLHQTKIIFFIFLLFLCITKVSTGFYQENDELIKRPEFQTALTEEQETVDNLMSNEEDVDSIPIFEDSLQIDGRTYKVSPNFKTPAGVDINSPVKINFDENTREVVSIERLVEDTSNNNFLE